MSRKHRIIIIIVNVVLLIFGIAILNTNKSGRTEKISEELVEANAVLPENEGKLVIVSGTPTLENDGIIVDEEAGLQVENAVSYSRIPYQLVYVIKKREIVVDKGDDKISDVDDKKEVRSYLEGEWIFANRERDASVTYEFKKYENPPAADMDFYIKTSDMRIGDFLCPSSYIDYIEKEYGYFTKEELEKNCKEYIAGSGIDLRVVEYGGENSGMLSSGNEIGDVKVEFTYETLKSVSPVTIIGRQEGDRIVIDEDDEINAQEHVLSGIVSREEYLDSIGAEDAGSRMFGIVMIIIALIGLALTVPKKGLKFKMKSDDLL